ncbi:MAG: alpha/beta hydrolase [Gammaproteobacteria bacterium]|nr:alpha/beta hydrolase [Gammaproteobacteria bacterium]
MVELSQFAAAADPDGYESMVLLGSSTGTFGAPAGTPEQPRNLLVVFSRYDEFSALMWGAPIPRDIVGTDKLQTLFGTDDAVEVGKLYGDLRLGNARKLVMPAVTHPGDHLSTEAIGAAADWFEATLGHEGGGRRTWHVKEFATLAALIGLAWLTFPVLSRLLRVGPFAGIERELPPPASVSRRRWLLRAGVAALVPAATFFPLQMLGNLILPPTSVLGQQITNGIVVWAWGTALINLGIFLLWYRHQRPGLARLGLRAEPGIIGRSALLAVIVAGVLLAIVALAEYVLNVDFRFWVVALKVPSAVHLGLIVVYLPLFAAFFLALSLALHPPLRRDTSLARAMWTNAAILSGGIVLLLLVQYIPLLAGGTLALASQPLLTIVAIQFVPLLAFVGLVSTYAYERTGSIYTGAFLNALLVTWYIVAGTATQAVPFWY